MTSKLDLAKQAIDALIDRDDLHGTIKNLNALRLHIHSHSPFKHEPVDCVVWVPADQVAANAYNPNSVAPPEMELLRTSIAQDGYTQPIVAWEQAPKTFEVVDGFHRNRVGKEYPEITQRIHGYLPLVVINAERQELGDRMVSTVRHNRARGKHSVDHMSDIVVELKRRNWTEAKISKNLGMDVDEILRLCQVSGLTEMFKDTDFSASWDVDDAAPLDDGDYEPGELTEGGEDDDAA